MFFPCLYNGDCLEEMSKIPEKSVDMIICDLPQPIKGSSPIQMSRLWQEYKRILKDRGVVLLFCYGTYYADIINSNRKMFKYDLIWDKVLSTGYLNAKKMPLRQHEQIAVFYKKLPTYNPQYKRGSTNVVRYNSRGRYVGVPSDKFPTSVMVYKKDHPSACAIPTQIPVSLLENLILTYTNEGDTVLDNCMGSGSTGVACKHTGRNFIGIEIDSDIFNCAVGRIASE